MSAVTDVHVQFEAIGTQWSIQINQPVVRTVWRQLLQKIHERIGEFDRAYSRFRGDSLVARIAEDSGTHRLPPDGFKLLQFYEQLYAVTDGYVTPFIGQTISDTGYDATYSFQYKQPHKPPKWEDALTYDKHRLTVTEPVLLDFGAAGKGYLVDIIGELLESADIRSFLIDAGGDILHRSASQQAIEVGLENPLDTSEAIGSVRLSNQSLCASAGNKRHWKGYHHILDPNTLESPQDILATWVLAEETIIADGLATALFFTDPDTLAKHFSFSYAILNADMSMRYSTNFPAKFFEPETA